MDGSNREEEILYFNIHRVPQVLSHESSLLTIKMANKIHAVESTQLLSYTSHTHYLFITVPNQVWEKLLSAKS